MTGMEGGELQLWESFFQTHLILAAFWRQWHSSLLLRNTSLVFCHVPLICISNTIFHCKIPFSWYSSLVCLLWCLGSCRDLRTCILQYLFPFCKYTEAHCNTSWFLQLAYECIVLPTEMWLKCRRWEQLLTVKSQFPVGLFWARGVS